MNSVMMERVKLIRERWLLTYRGPYRWQHGSGAKQGGFIALARVGTENDPLPTGTLEDGAEYTVIDNKYRAYTHRLFEKNGNQYIIGDVSSYPVRAPLFRIEEIRR
jgi:hypothetical protein